MCCNFRQHYPQDQTTIQQAPKFDNKNQPHRSKFRNEVETTLYCPVVTSGTSNQWLSVEYQPCQIVG